MKAVLEGFPPGLKIIKDLRLFSIRNHPLRSGLRECKELIKNRDIPDVSGAPQAFTDSLAGLEDNLGTSRAVLIGLIASRRKASKEDALEGLDSFERIKERMPQKREDDPEKDLLSLFDLAATFLSFSRVQNDFLQTLSIYEANLAGEALETGNCINCSGLFALLAASLGHLSAEFHPINSYHNSTYFPESGLYFDMQEIGAGLYDHPLGIELPGEGVRSSLFSLVSSALALDVFLSLKMGAYSRDDIEIMYNQLECAEAVNPFYINIYRLKAVLSLKLDLPQDFETNMMYAEKMYQSVPLLKTVFGF